MTIILSDVATLPCETLMSAKQDINKKLQGSIATYLRCGGVVNNHIKKSCHCYQCGCSHWSSVHAL